MFRANVGLAVAVFAGLLAASSPAIAHCDGMDGPVVRAAQKALETGNIDLVLPWVQSSDEPEIRNVFGAALAVRKLGTAARELADRHFLETLVRVHRAGEGASYTGLKPAGRNLGPAIPAADRAIEDGSAERLLALLARDMQRGVEQRFRTVMEKKSYAVEDARAGRDFVAAYVEFIHYVERVYNASAASTEGAPASGEHGDARHEH
jgi:hypothetical protein